MSSNNNGTSPEMMGFAFIMAGFMLAAYFLFALLAFGALLFTLLAFCRLEQAAHPVWARRPIRTRRAAFVFRGRLPARSSCRCSPPSASCCSRRSFERMTFWGYLVIGGYAAGSLGIEILRQQEAAEQQEAGGFMMPTIEHHPARRRCRSLRGAGSENAANEAEDRTRKSVRPSRSASPTGTTRRS